MAFATLEQFEAHLQESVSNPVSAKQALDIATARIQDYTGQRIEAVPNESVLLQPTYSRLLPLPELPVTGVDSVVENGLTLVANTDYELWPGGLLYRGVGWRYKVTVIYDHGYAVVPTALMGLTCQIAARIYNPADEGGQVASETLMDYSVTYREGSPVALLSEEETVLDDYRPRQLK